LSELPGIAGFYLAGASAITWHLGHRRSADLDLFSITPRCPLEAIERASGRLRGVKVLEGTDVMIALEVEGVPVDLVKYAYPPLESPLPGPRRFPVAGLLDLAAMKLTAIARRGIQRDFWDLYEILHAGITLPQAAAAYVQRFGRTKGDLYHVERALTWFEDAERNPVRVKGLTPAKWARIKSFFVEQAPALILER
jgi:hypothetical protein